MENTDTHHRTDLSSAFVQSAPEPSDGAAPLPAPSPSPAEIKPPPQPEESRGLPCRLSAVWFTSLDTPPFRSFQPVPNSGYGELMDLIHSMLVRATDRFGWPCRPDAITQWRLPSTYSLASRDTFGSEDARLFASALEPVIYKKFQERTNPLRNEPSLPGTRPLRYQVSVYLGCDGPDMRVYLDFTFSFLAGARLLPIAISTDPDFMDDLVRYHGMCALAPAKEAVCTALRVAFSEHPDVYDRDSYSGDRGTMSATVYSTRTSQGGEWVMDRRKVLMTAFPELLDEARLLFRQISAPSAPGPGTRVRSCNVHMTVMPRDTFLGDHPPITFTFKVTFVEETVPDEIQNIRNEADVPDAELVLAMYPDMNSLYTPTICPRALSEVEEARTRAMCPGDSEDDGPSTGSPRIPPREGQAKLHRRERLCIWNEAINDAIDQMFASDRIEEPAASPKRGASDWTAAVAAIPRGELDWVGLNFIRLPIGFTFGERTCSVDARNPIVKILLRNREALGLSAEDLNATEGDIKYEIETALVQALLKFIKDDAVAQYERLRARALESVPSPCFVPPPVPSVATPQPTAGLLLSASRHDLIPFRFDPPIPISNPCGEQPRMEPSAPSLACDPGIDVSKPFPDAESLCRFVNRLEASISEPPEPGFDPEYMVQPRRLEDRYYADPLLGWERVDHNQLALVPASGVGPVAIRHSRTDQKGLLWYAVQRLRFWGDIEFHPGRDSQPCYEVPAFAAAPEPDSDPVRIVCPRAIAVCGFSIKNELLVFSGTLCRPRSTWVVEFPDVPSISCPKTIAALRLFKLYGTLWMDGKSTRAPAISSVAPPAQPSPSTAPSRLVPLEMGTESSEPPAIRQDVLDAATVLSYLLTNSSSDDDDGESGSESISDNDDDDGAGSGGDEGRVHDGGLDSHGEEDVSRGLDLTRVCDPATDPHGPTHYGLQMLKIVEDAVSQLNYPPPETPSRSGPPPPPSVPTEMPQGPPSTRPMTEEERRRFAQSYTAGICPGATTPWDIRRAARYRLDEAGPVTAPQAPVPPPQTIPAISVEDCLRHLGYYRGLKAFAHLAPTFTVTQLLRQLPSAASIRNVVTNRTLDEISQEEITSGSAETAAPNPHARPVPPPPSISPETLDNDVAYYRGRASRGYRPTLGATDLIRIHPRLGCERNEHTGLSFEDISESELSEGVHPPRDAPPPTTSTAPPPRTVLPSRPPVVSTTTAQFCRDHFVSSYDTMRLIDRCIGFAPKVYTGIQVYGDPRQTLAMLDDIQLLASLEPRAMDIVLGDGRKLRELHMALVETWDPRQLWPSAAPAPGQSTAPSPATPPPPPKPKSTVIAPHSETAPAVPNNQDPPPISDDKACVICLDAPRTALALPCKHMSTCDKCMRKIPTPQKCPICRALIQHAILGVYT